MTKRRTIESVRRAPEPGVRSSAVWAGVARRLRRRRGEFGFGASHVASCVGISVGAYEGYEAGFPVPASSLAQIAELFDVPVMWFFQDVAQDVAQNVAQDVAYEVADEEPAGLLGELPSTEPVVYTVATVEHRAQALVDSFRKLDLEGQQHLLAISMALTRAGADAVPD